MTRHKPRHRKSRFEWLTRPGESTWRGFLTFSSTVTVICSLFFITA